MSERFLCPERNSVPGVFKVPKDDEWRKLPNGDRVCSFCGSLHEDDFLEIIEAYADGKEGYHFDPSTKGYKRYASRPGVANAAQGGIKFYGWHADLTPGPALDRKNALFARAIERFRAEIEARSARKH